MKICDTLPQIYIDINKKGYTNYANFKSFHDIDNNYLCFINLMWLSYDEIIQGKVEEFHSIKMIPFAYTIGGGYWCLDLNHKGYTPIVCCYHEDREAIYYTKTLEAALFRQILEFACSRFTNSDIKNKCSLEPGKKIILNWISKLKGYFPDEWILELDSIINAKDYTNIGGGDVSMLSDIKYGELIKKYIEFDLLDKKFIWTSGDVAKFYK